MDIKVDSLWKFQCYYKKKVSSTPHRLSTAARFFSGISNIQFSAQLISRNKKKLKLLWMSDENSTQNFNWIGLVMQRNRQQQQRQRGSNNSAEIYFKESEKKSLAQPWNSYPPCRAARDFFIFQFGFPSAAVCCLHSRKLTFENLDQLIRINYRWVPQMVNDWVSTVFISLLFGMINRVQQQLNWFSESRSGWGLLYVCCVFSDPSERAKANHWEKRAGENIIYWMKLTLQSRNEHLPN